MLRKSMMKPRTRVDHAKPILGMRDWRTRGKRTPPKAAPPAAMPVAFPRRRLKKWETAAMEGVKRRAVPRPPRTPKTMMKCQYSGRCESSMVEHDGERRTSADSEEKHIQDYENTSRDHEPKGSIYIEERADIYSAEE